MTKINWEVVAVGVTMIFGGTGLYFVSNEYIHRLGIVMMILSVPGIVIAFYRTQKTR